MYRLVGSHPPLIGKTGGRQLIALAVLLVSGCGGSGSKNDVGAKSAPATITADPNPVPAGTGKASTTITWDTGDGSTGQVYVSVNEGPEQLFADNRPKGSHTAQFIEKGIYDFILYKKASRAQSVAKVRVLREKP